MSGHSKWSTIKREKGAKDAKRGAVFTKLGNQIAIAARGGTDPSMNASLAMAVEKAKQANMPAANIQRAIDRVSDKNAAVLEETIYEGMGPQGVGIIIKTATDNKNRTLPEVRNALTKNGGHIADSGSVMFQFTQKGVIRLKDNTEETLMAALEAGAEDAVTEDNELVVYTDKKDLAKVRKNLLDAKIDVLEADLEYVPNTKIEISDAEIARKLVKLFDALDDLDDVVSIYSNDDIMVEIE